MNPLPAHIAELIRQGRKLEAIELIRQETGVGPAEAKDAVERLAAGMDPLPAPALASNALPAEVEALARAGHKLEAIRVLRAQTGLGLQEAKERVEAIPGVPAARGAALSVVAAILLLVLGIVMALLMSAAD